MFRPGTTINITWSYKVSSPFMYRRWMFTAYGSSSRRLVADIDENSGISYHHMHHEIHLKIYKPLTLELINMNSSYNGEYTLMIHSLMGHYWRSINVYIVGKL